MTTVQNHDDGYLEMWLGPMFSGKTTQLIQTYKQYTYIDKTIAVVNYNGDKRYHDTMLSTHDQIMIPCIQSSTLSEIIAQLECVDVILINEGQFFCDIFDITIDLVEKHKKIVYIYGLDGDFQRNKFGRVLDLIPYCDRFTKLHSMCASCKNGKPALFSKRISSEVGQIVIGSDNYKPLCRRCYNSS